MNKKWTITIWAYLHGRGGSWRTLFRMNNDINQNSGNWKGRTLWMAHYGYGNYNYMYFCFSDITSSGHAY